MVFQTQKRTCEAFICIILEPFCFLLEFFPFAELKTECGKQLLHLYFQSVTCDQNSVTSVSRVLKVTLSEEKLPQIIQSACFQCIIYVKGTPLFNQLHAHAATNSTDIFKSCKTNLFHSIAFKWKKINCAYNEGKLKRLTLTFVGRSLTNTAYCCANP